jgi:hypothetical protein
MAEYNGERLHIKMGGYTPTRALCGEASDRTVPLDMFVELLPNQEACKRCIKLSKEKN